MPTKKVGPVELYYEEHGSGAPLLLIMGLAVDSQGWMLQTPEFAKHYRTIVFDNRGVGRSSKPQGPYTTAQMAADAAGLLDALDIETAHVVGISMGGMIAQELALAHPERVRGLVLACTYAEPGADIMAASGTMITEFGGALGDDSSIQLDPSKLDPFAFFQALMPRVFNPSFLQNHLQELMQMFGGALQWGFSTEAILAQVAACMGHRTTDRLASLAAPTLVITGDSDLLVPAERSDALAAAIPNAALVKLAGGSHGFNFEAPEFFNSSVLEFLERVSA